METSIRAAFDVLHEAGFVFESTSDDVRVKIIADMFEVSYTEGAGISVRIDGHEIPVDVFDGISLSFLGRDFPTIHMRRTHKPKRIKAKNVKINGVMRE